MKIRPLVGLFTNINRGTFHEKIFCYLLSTIVCMFLIGCTNSTSIPPSSMSDKEYTVTFNGNGGKLVSGVENQKVHAPEEIKEPTYERFGYDFYGWDKDITKIYNTTTVFAQWSDTAKNDTDIQLSGFTRNNNDFTYKVNNNISSFSFIDKVKVSSGSSWKLFFDISGTQEIITKTIGLEIGDNNVYILVTSANGNLGFYSICIRRLNMFTVSFETNGGSYIPSQQIQEESLIQPVESPTKNGYQFKTWDYDFTQPVMSDLIVNALWQAHKLTITFDVNGGNPFNKNTMEVSYGSYVSLPTPTCVGHSFLGWYNGISKITSGTWEIDSDITLVAKWNANTYKITYVLNKGKIELSDGNYSPDGYSENIIFGSMYSCKKAVRTGYDFLGWFDNNNNRLETGTWMIDRDLTVYASWKAKSFTITYNVNGGDALDSLTQKVSFDAYYKLVNPTKKGYSFKGWSDGKNLLQQSGTWKLLNDVYLMATWEANEYSITPNYISTKTIYKITFDYNDGTNRKKIVELTGGSDKLDYFVPENSTQTIFLGWCLDRNCTKVYDFYDKKNLISQDTTFYGKWGKPPFNLKPLVYGESKDVNSEITEYSIYGGSKGGTF